VQQSQDINSQYAVNHDNAQSALSLEDTNLSTGTELMTRVRELTTQAGNTNLTPANRQSIATELRARYDELLGIANATDGTGQYIFSGYQGNTRPFSGTIDDIVNGTIADITYAGDDGQRGLQIAPSRQVAVSDAGSDVFQRTGSGESVFKTIASLVGALEAPPTPAYSTQIATALTNVGHAADNFLRVRAGIGSRQNEVTATATMNADLKLQYATTLTNLVGVDMVQALSDLSRAQTTLDAAEKSFKAVSQLSLFNYL